VPVWQVVASFGALALAVPGVLLGVAGFVRASRATDSKERADAAQVGLGYLERALKAQQDTIVRQQGEIGELRGQLVACRQREEATQAQLAELREQLK
jgi:hypothetical protein